LKLKLLVEKELRLRIRRGHAEVYLRKLPKDTLGRVLVGRNKDTECYDEALELVNQVIGRVLPVDIIARQYLDRYQGVLYREGSISHFHCPLCSGGLFFDDITLNKDTVYDFFIVLIVEIDMI